MSTPASEVPRGTTEPANSPLRVPALLTWRTIDEHHAKTECDRYSVARVTVLGAPHYIAWERTPPITEIGSVVLTPEATEAERAAARASMKARCAEHAAARQASGVAA